MLVALKEAHLHGGELGEVGPVEEWDGVPAEGELHVPLGVEAGAVETSWPCTYLPSLAVDIISK